MSRKWWWDSSSSEEEPGCHQGALFRSVCHFLRVILLLRCQKRDSTFCLFCFFDSVQNKIIQNKNFTLMPWSSDEDLEMLVQKPENFPKNVISWRTVTWQPLIPCHLCTGRRGLINMPCCPSWASVWQAKHILTCQEKQRNEEFYAAFSILLCQSSPPLWFIHWWSHDGMFWDQKSLCCVWCLGLWCRLRTSTDRL